MILPKSHNADLVGDLPGDFPFCKSRSEWEKLQLPVFLYEDVMPESGVAFLWPQGEIFMD